MNKLLENLILVTVTLFLIFGLVVFSKSFFFTKRYITVSGNAKSENANKLASFTVTVSTQSDNKETAVLDNNNKTNKVIDAIKNFGIEDKDIKTNNINVYQQDEYNPQTGKSTKGQWKVDNSINVELKDADKTKATNFASLISKTEATNVYGPNFKVNEEGVNSAEKDLITKAMIDARTKADSVAKSSGLTVGRFVSVTEGGNYNYDYGYKVAPAMEGMGGGGSMPIEPGSSTISKSVSVTFEVW